VLTGQSTAPAQLSRLGPITAAQAVPLAHVASLDLHARWRVILTDAAGRATAVERVHRPPRRQPAPPPGITGQVTVIVPATALDDDPNGGQGRAGKVQDAILRAARRAAARTRQQVAADTAAGGCAHTMASPAYQPPPRIRELVEARDQTCRQPTCRQPARHTDLDHTIPFDQGGPTCGCNLGPRCRTHHQIKQEPGWKLIQPTPGTFHLTTPAGRTYTTRPDPHLT
jgi:hypothetical protein